MKDDKKRQSVGIHIEDCDKVKLGNNKIEGYDKGIVVKNSTKITAKANEIILNSQNIDYIKEEIIDSIDREFEKVKKQERREMNKDKLIDFLSNTISGIISNVVTKF